MQTPSNNLKKELIAHSIYKHYKGKKYEVPYDCLNSQLDIERWILYQELYLNSLP